MAKQVDHDYFKEFAEALALKLAKEGNGLHKLDLQYTLTKHLSDDEEAIGFASSEELQEGTGHNRPNLKIENLSQLNKFRNNVLKLAEEAYKDNEHNHKENIKALEKIFDKARKDFIKDREQLKRDIHKLDKNIKELEKHYQKQLASDDKRVSRWAKHTLEKIEALKASYNDDVEALKAKHEAKQIERLHDLKIDVHNQFLGDGVELFNTNNELNLNIIEKTIPKREASKIYQGLSQVANLSKEMVLNNVEETINNDALQKALSNYTNKRLEEWRVENQEELEIPEDVIKDIKKDVEKVFLSTIVSRDIKKDIQNDELFVKRVDFIVEKGVEKFETHDVNTRKFKALKNEKEALQKRVEELEKEQSKARPLLKQSLDKQIVEKEVVDSVIDAEEAIMPDLDIVEDARELVKQEETFNQKRENFISFYYNINVEDRKKLDEILEKKYTKKDGNVDFEKLSKESEFVYKDNAIVGMKNSGEEFGNTNPDDMDHSRGFKF